MQRFLQFLKSIFVYERRYLLWLQIVLGLLIFLAICPNLDLNLKFLGIKDPVVIRRLDLSKSFLKYEGDLSLKPAGGFTGHKEFTFSTDKKLSKEDFDKISGVLASRFSHRGDKDMELASNYKKREISVITNAKTDETYITRTVASTGKYEVLKYNETDADSSIGFFLKENYSDLDIDRSDFTRIARLSLDEKLPDDPAARFEIRITLSKEAHEKIVSEGSGSYFGVFADDEFVGFLQNFASDKYLITNLNNGDDFYVNFGRLKAPVIETELELKSTTDIPAQFNPSTVQAVILQLIFVAVIITAILTVIYRYKGLVTMITVLFSAEIAILILKLSRAYLSEYTLIGFAVALCLSVLLVVYWNILMRKKQKDFYYLLLLVGTVIVGSYLAQSFIEQIQATFFVPLIFVMITTVLNILSLNNLLLEERNEGS